MFNNLNPYVLLAARRKPGVSTKDALLVSFALQSPFTRTLGAAGNFLLADNITDRIGVRSEVPVAAAPVVDFSSQTQGIEIAPLPGIAPIVGVPFPTIPPRSTTGSGGQQEGQSAAPQTFFQGFEGVDSVKFDKTPPEITGKTGLKVDFICPVTAAKQNWDFGQNSGHQPSSAKNPTMKTYANAGTFNVVLTTEDSTGTETDTPVAKIIVQ